jgi:cell division septation protein DedD
MDSAMRDLEQIREKGSDGEGRPLALVGMLIGVTVALVLAIGMSAGGFEREATGEGDDPLARLDRAAGLEAQPPEQAAPATTEVRRSDLTFPEALAPEDERPEVAAAFAQAAAELAHPEPLPASDGQPIEALPPTLPVALAAAPGSEALVREAARDPMFAQALPTLERGQAAPAGRDGEYTVQVISYDSVEGADAFAAGLRARGHRAFVMRAEIPGRGTVHRVRVGPFETLRDAQAFRHQFEQTERMNTLLVHRTPEDA